MGKRQWGLVAACVDGGVGHEKKERNGMRSGLCTHETGRGRSEVWI